MPEDVAKYGELAPPTLHFDAKRKGPVEWDQVYEHISVIFRTDFIYQPHVAQARFILYRYQVVIDYYERLEYQPHRIVREAPRALEPVEDDQELYHLLFDEEYGISSDEEEPF
ncbi:uncharacterized protein LAESUDRAFT_763952 [Laetiporus sulphureus 93-53]|uniref:Uncharacterized protein n=1 Tax=Laetiporus sulphureus 93-53 TaxID=1314785 RepID=A0A165BL39_9APHY|nr:uncharacterized protein LAESUDRAFT_763952 [Laetiporus sulphureus 93-53]KZT01252.1 hypothetical protein LAESUDRAFT_763952 [Laetiporus sulphureus 93-53]